MIQIAFSAKNLALQFNNKCYRIKQFFKDNFFYKNLNIV